MNNSAAPSPDTLEIVLQEWADARNRPTVCLVTRGKADLAPEHVIQLWSKLDGTHSELDFIIHSPGGDPHSAYQLAELLRRHTQDPKKGLTAIVPLLAASAATLACLACDEIVLDDMARLGPLDMQVYEDLKGGMYRFSSALHPQYALKQLNEISLASLLSTKIALVNDGVLGDEAYAIAKDFVVGLYKDLYAQISPERLAEYSRALEVNLKYAQGLLKRHSSLSERDQEKLANKLVRDYPSHSYYIDFDEARAIQLPVVRMPSSLRTLAVRLLIQVHRASVGVRVVMPTAKSPATAPASRKSSAGRRKKAPSRAEASKRRALTAAVNGKHG